MKEKRSPMDELVETDLTGYLLEDGDYEEEIFTLDGKAAE